MTWQGIQGHDEVAAMFRRGLSRGRMAGAFLFVGPEGVGKRLFALKLAQTLLCQRTPEAEMAPCGECPGCVQTVAQTHPDLQLVSKPPDKNVLPVELFIGRKERRMQEGLCHDISLKPFMGRRKVALIDDADFLAAEGANCLLKTLEEPPPASTLILIGTSPEKQLPTIRSRCQLVRFQPLAAEIIAELVLAQGIAEDAQQAQRMARHAEGSLRRAADLADAALWDFRGKLIGQLARHPLNSVKLAAAVTSFVDEAGKEAPVRRARARQVIGFAIEFYQLLVRSLSGAELPDDTDLLPHVLRRRETWTGDAETAIACVHRCLDALGHIQRNAAPATLLECWLDDLGRIIASGHALVG